MPTTSWNRRPPYGADPWSRADECRREAERRIREADERRREAERRLREAERQRDEAERRRRQDNEERWVLIMLFGVSLLLWVNLLIAAR